MREAQPAFTRSSAAAPAQRVRWAAATFLLAGSCSVDQRQVTTAFSESAAGAGGSTNTVSGPETPAAPANTGNGSSATGSTNGGGDETVPSSVSNGIMGSSGLDNPADAGSTADAAAPPGVLEACGNGRVEGAEECDDGDTDDTNSCTASCRKRQNVVFVTSTVYTVATLGGISGGDAACAARAAAGNLQGNFVAYLSSSTSPIESRIGAARGWVRVDGRPFLKSLSEATTFFPPELDEFGTLVPAPALTNGVTTPDTLPFAVGDKLNGTCSDWTPGLETTSYYAAGDPTGGNGSWSGVSIGQRCDTQFRLYCFQKDFANDLTVTRSAGRLAFVSKDPWAPVGGLAQADAQCAADAQAAGFAGSFKAFLATTTASAASRFSASGPPWVRADGIPIVQNAADLFQEGGRFVTPLQLTAGGIYLFNHGGWVGSVSPLGLGTPESTCNDWRTNDGTAIAGRVQYSEFPQAFGLDTGLPCSNGFVYLYCLQE